MTKAAVRVYEHNARSIVKTITYRFLIFVSSFIITYLYTHELGTSTRITIVINAAATIIYYFHERAWNTIHWGRSHHPNTTAKIKR